jgi:hypothetical protein
MMMLKRIARLFTIKTRFEAFAVIYAIAVGAVERGRHYMETYPGNSGVLLAVVCTGVVFVAGAKLLDSVRPVEPAPVPVRVAPRRRATRNRAIRDRQYSAARAKAFRRPD